MAQFDLKHAIIKVLDGTSPTPNELEIHTGKGSVSYSEKRNINYMLDRGLLDEVVEGDQAPMEVKLDFIWEFLSSISGASAPTIEEAFKNTGVASTWVTSDSDPCRPYAVDLQITYTPICDSVQIETITLPDFRWESFDHNLNDGSVSVSGKCNATKATLARSAQT